MNKSSLLHSTFPVVHSIYDLEKRIEALGAASGLRTLLGDQIRILRRIEDDPVGLFLPDDTVGEMHKELTNWERIHLAGCLGEWLDVLEANNDLATPVELDVRFFGAVGDGVTDDRHAVERALTEAGKIGNRVVLRFPRGRYRFSQTPGTKTHLLITDLQDLVIAGEVEEGRVVTEWIGSGSAAIMTMVNCRNVRMQGIAFDYDPPLYSQSRIVSISEDRRKVVVRLDKGFPKPTDPLYEGLESLAVLVLGDRDKLIRNSHQAFAAGEWVSESEGHWTLTGKAGQTLPAHAAVGNALLIYRRYKWAQAVVVNRCAWIDFSGVQVWGAPEFAFFVESSLGVSLRDCLLGPKPGCGRLGGLNADGLHARSNRFGPFLIDSQIRRPLDDCLNFQSRMVSVVKVENSHELILDLTWDEKDRIGYWQPSRFDYTIGDFLLFVDPVAGRLDGWGRIESVESIMWRGHLRMKARMDRPLPPLVSREAIGKHYPVPSSSDFLDLKVDQPIEHFVINASTKSDGFVIRGCKMGDNTVTAGKIKAGNGLIINNLTYNHGWCVWSFATEYVWQEGYAARRILMEGNTHDTWFGIYMGSQHPYGKNHLGPQLNYRLDIIDNHFVGIQSGEYAVDVNGVVGCTIKGNTLPERSIVIGPSATGVVCDDNHPVAP